MKPIKTDIWIPTDSMVLEKNAFDVATKIENNLVVAGPGAGKTELLAQKACFLLQTNTCKFPHKILAISFKRDAAYNLKERVTIRCGEELAKRFESLTFDSFAKQLFDRFNRALPSDYKIKSEYDVLLDDRFILEFYQFEDINYVNSVNTEIILKHHHAKLPHSINDIGDSVRNKVWSKMIQQSKLSFKMIMRLAEYIVNTNPKIKEYLQETYHFVFLDEFQDTTEIQYNFFKSCFLGSDSIFTAVGDDKQRIMVWAGAQESIFEDFLADTAAARIPLSMNFRCAPRLVKLLNHLTEHLLRKTDIAIPSPKWQPDQGECAVWIFENPTSEMQILFQEVQAWIVKDKINPRDICILVKQQLGQYAGELIKYFNQNGIKARDENKLQDMLVQEVSIYVISVLYIIFQKKYVDARQTAFNFLSHLHTELEDHQLLKLEASFTQFLTKMKTEYSTNAINEDQIKKIFEEIINFANKERITASFSSYKNNNLLDQIIADLQNEFIKNYNTVNDMVLALDMLVGKDTIPVMTIHKSKGLEYHTVIFIGLEDGAFWTFQQQEDEDKCAFFVALSRAKERVVFTFSKQRLDRFGRTRAQSIANIKVLFQELQNSGIVEMNERKD
ncbi:UvrD-helicase domain-containing protein [Chryseobacterium sp. MEBOG07]|uniref:UvrD-helicase domain-containing protein n=1 Tax=Chryseobacterium sp. MEBOG07 TaxID=2879939 RepID=UPI001F275264|nr:ATP-dependent helicase [Chryseobacterium sp. MEBOG07]UKB78634.1 ATP-dependent helicase [Chryseobacterium sp. MEBOG07]